jgi:hypothetical protein
VFLKQHKLEAARDELRMAIEHDALLPSGGKAAALHAIADINEKLPTK